MAGLFIPQEKRRNRYASYWYYITEEKKAERKDLLSHTTTERAVAVAATAMYVYQGMTGMHFRQVIRGRPATLALPNSEHVRKVPYARLMVSGLLGP